MPMHPATMGASYPCTTGSPSNPPAGMAHAIGKTHARIFSSGLCIFHTTKRAVGTRASHDFRSRYIGFFSFPSRDHHTITP